MPNGYGQVRFKDKTVMSHRVAWILANGEIPEGMFVLHKCDNRKCVNPEHLFIGTFDENMADMVKKDRHARGTRNGHAKLNDDEVREIRSLSGTCHEIGAMYNVTHGLVSLIRARKIWRHI